MFLVSSDVCEFVGCKYDVRASPPRGAGIPTPMGDPIITAAGAVDREFFYIKALPGPPRAPPEPPLGWTWARVVWGIEVEGSF